MNSMCNFMENIFTGTKYIQNIVENLEEAFQTKTKRGVGVSLVSASFSQESNSIFDSIDTKLSNRTNWV